MLLTRGVWTLLLLVWATAGPSATAAVLESNAAIDDVVSAYNSLRHEGEWLSAWPAPGMPESGAFPEATDKHYQGIQRAPFHPNGSNDILYVTRSGRVQDPDDLGFLAVIKLGTRDSDGERFRSNLLLRDAETSSTGPSSADRVVSFINFLNYQHPGGMQMVGDILAVPLEAPYNPSFSPGQIRFFDCSNPLSPVRLPYLRDFDHNVGVVGLTKLPEPDGHFLLLVTWGDNETVEFYRSSKTSFLDADFEFTLHYTWRKSDQPSIDWEKSQSLNFVNQTDGRLFLVASWNTSAAAPIFNGDDRMQLYEVHGFGAGQAISFSRPAGEREITLRAPDEPGQQEYFGNFNAGGGTYISPSGELLYYAIHHYDVPDVTVGVRLRMAELRHYTVNRNATCGPQFRENHLGGPHTIDEGSTLLLDGTVRVVEPWVDMFGDPDGEGRPQMMDYRDQGEDDYQDFSKLDGGGLGGQNGFGDELSSFRWCGTSNYTLQIFHDDNFTGSVAAAAQGTGSVGGWNVGGSHEDEASSARILLTAPPEHVGYAWDIDGDGVLQEFLGQPRATFGPRNGSSVNTVRLAFDGVQVSTTVNVVNVPPTVPSIGVTPYTAHEDSVVRLQAVWTDPGTTAHTATIYWGDGHVQTVDFGVSKTGSVDLTHTYRDDDPTGTPVDVYTVTVAVDDSFGGLGLGHATATIANLPPVVDAGIAVERIDERTTWNRSGSFSDVGTLDSWTATVNFGDGSGEIPLGLDADKTFDPSHYYAADGVFTVAVTVTDDDTGTDTDHVEVRATNLDPYFSIATLQLVDGFSAGPAHVYRVADSLAPVTGYATFLPATADLNMLDVDESAGMIHFGVAALQFAYFPGGTITLHPGRIYARFADGRIGQPTDVAGLQLPFDALDKTGEGYVFSTSSLSFLAGKVLRNENAYLYRPATATVELAFDGRLAGLQSLDGFDVLADGTFAVSVAHDQFLAGFTARQQNVYRYAPASGAWTLLFDGIAHGLENLDALSLGSSGGEYPDAPAAPWKGASAVSEPLIFKTTSGKTGVSGGI